MIPQFSYPDDVYVKEYGSESKYNPDTDTTTYYRPVEFYKGKLYKEGKRFLWSPFEVDFSETIDSTILIQEALELRQNSLLFVYSYHNEEDEEVGQKFEVLKSSVVRNPISDKIEYTKYAVKYDSNTTKEEFLSATS